jgi:hypothetical protein
LTIVSKAIIPGNPRNSTAIVIVADWETATRFLASADPLAPLVLTERADLYGNVPSSSLDRTLVIVIDTFVVRQSRPELAIVVDNSLPIIFLFTAAT